MCLLCDDLTIYEEPCSLDGEEENIVSWNANDNITLQLTGREREEMANIQVCTSGLHVIPSVTVKYGFVLIDKDECKRREMVEEKRAR